MTSKWKQKEWKEKHPNEKEPKSGFIPKEKDLSYAFIGVVSHMTEKVGRLLIGFNQDIKHDLIDFKNS